MAIELTTAPLSALQDIREALNIGTAQEVFPEATFNFTTGSAFISLNAPRAGTKVNFRPLHKCSTLNIGNGNISTFEGAEYLTELEDFGTQSAFILSNCGFSAETLNQLFTDLPETNKTATINVVGNPGAATCDATIAENKGYIVVTE